MNCPKCGSSTKVPDSRKRGNCIQRRRRCTNCEYTFNTLEIPTEILNTIKHRLKVVKKDKNGRPIISSNQLMDILGLIEKIPEVPEGKLRETSWK